MEAGVEFGTTVEAGQVMGYSGNSGNASAFAVEAPPHEDNSQPPDAAALSATGAHLHFEIRIDSSHLGAGLPPNQARALLARAFSRRYRWFRDSSCHRSLRWDCSRRPQPRARAP